MLTNNVYLMLGTDCNLNCEFCFVRASQVKIKDKNFSWGVRRLIELIEENMKNYTATNIIFFGGEPLLYFETIKKYISVISTVFGEKSDKIQWSITTNLLSDGALNKLLQLMQMVNLEITVSYDTEGRFPSAEAEEKFINLASFLSNEVILKVTTVIKDDIDTHRLLSVIRRIKPRYLQLEKMTNSRNVVVPIKEETLQAVKDFISELPVGTHLVGTESGVGCFRNGCTSKTIIPGLSITVRGCVKRLSSLFDESQFCQNVGNKHDNLKVCMLCSKFKKCSAFCSISGCTNPQSENWYINKK